MKQSDFDEAMEAIRSAGVRTDSPPGSVEESEFLEALSLLRQAAGRLRRGCELAGERDSSPTFDAEDPKSWPV